jgi:hypothetical protein
MTSKNEFSPRTFLRDRQAVLVHFSTVMTRHPDLTFPHDLLRAMTLKAIPLAFSTIQTGDTNPFAEDGRGGAEGSIGMLVDIGPRTKIRSVSPGDSGSNPDGSLGLPPTAENCASSIDDRETSNEWHIQDFIPIGVFVLPPLLTRQVKVLMGEPISGDTLITFGDAIAPFPDHRIFSAREHRFVEFDRASAKWRDVAYDDIIVP